MQFKLILVLMVCTFYYTRSKPLRNDKTDSDVDEFDAEDDNEIAVDESNDENNNDFMKQNSASEDEQERGQGETLANSYQEPNPDGINAAGTDTNLFADFKIQYNKDANNDKYPESLGSDEKIESPTNHRHSIRYAENSNLNSNIEPMQHFNKPDAKIYKASPLRNMHDNLYNKKTMHSYVDENVKYDNNNQINYDDVKYRSNNKDIEQERYLRHHYDTIQNGNIFMDDNEHVVLNRDRRNVQEIKQNSEEVSDNKNEYMLGTDNLEEEAAIKKHIKNLSDVDIEELLNSLNEEKRALLKKIIDNDNTNNAAREVINKREITKKAGAVEDNSFIENVQSDANKIQGGPPIEGNSDSSGSHNTDTRKLANKQSESPGKVSESTSKSSEINSGLENNSESSSDLYQTNQIALDNANSYGSGNDAKNNVEGGSNVDTPNKSDTKREINLDDLEKNDLLFEDINNIENDYNDKNAHDTSFVEEYNINCAQDEDLAQINDDMIQSHHEKSYKREVTEKQSDETFDSIKALEESFPNFQASGNSVSYSGPLIRVKRTDFSDHNITEKQTEVLPFKKVRYCPLNAENLDEDYDEGNEFDDDGFHERSANLKMENKQIQGVSNSNIYKSDQNVDTNENFKVDGSNNISSNDNNESQIVKLGSDTDSVLSGVEGVDENLMFNSNYRNKRTLNMKGDKNTENDSFHSARSVPSTNMESNASPSNFEDPSYQETDTMI